MVATRRPRRRAPAAPSGGGTLARVARVTAGVVAVGVPTVGWIGARVLTDAPRFRPPRRSLRAWFTGPASPPEHETGEVQLSGDDADTPGTWGLLFDGGVAQVLDPTSWTLAGHDRRVVRPYLTLDGAVPTAETQVDRRSGDRRRTGDRRGSRRPSASIRLRRAVSRRRARRAADRRGGDRRERQVEGPWPVRAALTSYAFADDPQLLAARIGAEWRIEAVPSVGGHLPAWRFTPRPAPGNEARAKVWVIGVHGRGAQRTELFRLVSTVVSAGSTFLVTSYRTDAWTRHPAPVTTLGQEEWEDVDAAMRLAIDAGAEHIVLAGCSLGGAIAAQTVRRSTIADRITGVILDAPALRWHPILRHVAERRHIPQPLIPLVMQVARVRARLDWQALDHVAAASEFRHPILLFHGSEDPTVPVWLSDAFATARPDLVTYVRVEGAGHVRAWNTARVRYEREVTAFLARVAQRGVPAADGVTRAGSAGTRGRRAGSAVRSSRS